jgi:hypothetical protein
VRLIDSTGYSGRFWQQTWRYIDLDGRACWPSQSWMLSEPAHGTTLVATAPLAH